jgi:serine/threonine protein phosphatase 1
LGDFVDRGPDSRGVLDRLVALEKECRLVPLLGNHDELLRDICRGHTELLGMWVLFGGDATLASYGGLVPDGVPPEHLDFLENCLDFHETERHFFVHGNYVENLPFGWQPDEVLRWESLRHREPGPHCSGKTAIVGHTAQKNGEVFDLGHLKCVDTWIYGEGWLTAMEVETGQVWQVDQQGRPRCRPRPGSCCT